MLNTRPNQYCLIVGSSEIKKEKEICYFICAKIEVKKNNTIKLIKLVISISKSNNLITTKINLMSAFFDRTLPLG